MAITRAIVRQPRILIADEPTGNLDPKHAWDVIRVLEKLTDMAPPCCPQRTTKKSLTSCSGG